MRCRAPGRRRRRFAFPAHLARVKPMPSIGGALRTIDVPWDNQTSRKVAGVASPTTG
jgi:hypothetical protein